jgi:hypothetical protein
MFALRAQCGQDARAPFGLRLLTLTEATIPTKITSTRVLQLTGAFGAFADHCGHDGAGDLSSIGALLFA